MTNQELVNQGLEYCAWCPNLAYARLGEWMKTKEGLPVCFMHIMCGEEGRKKVVEEYKKLIVKIESE